MDSVTFTNPSVAAISKSVIFSKYNAEVDSQFAKLYGITGYPTMVIVKPNGAEIDRLVGFYPPEDFIPALFDVMQNRNTLDDYLTRLANYPDSAALRMEVAEKYKYRSQSDVAKMHYNFIIDSDRENLLGYSDDCLLSLGQMELKAKNYADAVGYFEMMQTEYPASELFEEANVYVPYTLMKAGEKKKAIKAFEAFKKEFPESEDLEWVDEQIVKIKEGKN
ncbi:MAG: outer membrane protein assembly factor BamD [candidate division Zixibacteria bacterium]|nr:outer membrane protein assembly factor BamD [candidate division Zixibacteria bacterium]MBU1470753.1 outer membrane protein assembly factor BamD [candidate division Zixibacteria bacterium]